VLLSDGDGRWDQEGSIVAKEDVFLQDETFRAILQELSTSTGVPVNDIARMFTLLGLRGVVANAACGTGGASLKGFTLDKLVEGTRTGFIGVAM
jgi:hypothetical protein